MRLQKIALLSLCLSFLGLTATYSQPQMAVLDAARAGQFFKEAKAVSEREGGKLWGVSLYGPMLLVDGRSRAVIANQADLQGLLRAEGEVFTGALPKEVNIANTATTWAGVKWTMIIWPLPEARQERLRLMLHELFHRIQEDIELPGNNPTNRHLDSQAGRTWLRLEWRALERALYEQGAARRTAIADALTFRRYRQTLFPEALRDECALETHEGLAEYTGLKLSAHSDNEFAALAVYGLRQAPSNRTFMRSFAYASGPAYGSLLDAAKIEWRRGLKTGDDLSARLQRGLRLKLPALTETAAVERARAYDGDEVIASEAEREQRRAAQTAKYRARLLDGPALVAPNAGSFNYSFNPNNLIALDEIGTVYPTARVTDDWGILEVSDGALFFQGSRGVTKVQVAAPHDPQARPLQGVGWKLELKNGWAIVPGPRQGDFVLQKQ